MDITHEIQIRELWSFGSACRPLSVILMDLSGMVFNLQRDKVKKISNDQELIQSDPRKYNLNSYGSCAPHVT